MKQTSSKEEVLDNLNQAFLDFETERKDDFGNDVDGEDVDFDNNGTGSEDVDFGDDDDGENVDFNDNVSKDVDFGNDDDGEDVDFDHDLMVRM